MNYVEGNFNVAGRVEIPAQLETALRAIIVLLPIDTVFYTPVEEIRISGLPQDQVDGRLGYPEAFFIEGAELIILKDLQDEVPFEEIRQNLLESVKFSDWIDGDIETTTEECFQAILKMIASHPDLRPFHLWRTVDGVG